MADWEFAIAVRDEVNLKSGHKRKKQGDIIAVKPAGWKWGKKEVDEYLIVPVSGLTKKEAHDLCQLQYEDGILHPEEDFEVYVPGWIANTPYRTAGESEDQVWGPDQIRTPQYIYVCIQGGISGEKEPIWITKVVDVKTIDSSAEVADGTVKWKCIKKCDVFKREDFVEYKLNNKINIDNNIYQCTQSGTTGKGVSLAKNLNAETVDGTVKWKSLGKINPKIIGKRRYAIPLDIIKKGWIPKLITSDVEDVKKVYQPLKNDKIKIDFTEKVKICRDNYKGSFRYSVEKTVLEGAN